MVSLYVTKNGPDTNITRVPFILYLRTFRNGSMILVNLKASEQERRRKIFNTAPSFVPLSGSKAVRQRDGTLVHPPIVFRSDDRY